MMPHASEQEPAIDASFDKRPFVAEKNRSAHRPWGKSVEQCVDARRGSGYLIVHGKRGFSGKIWQQAPRRAQVQRGLCQR
jgi:hypothetical protein